MKQKNKWKQNMKSFLWFSITMMTFALLFPITTVKAEQIGTKTYTVKAASIPYQSKYQSSSTYNHKTKQYYMLRSYLEQLEKVGGGTLILSKGTYVVTNTLYISSKVTLLLKDGVKIVKSNDTGTKNLIPTKSIFQLIAPSKAGKTAVATKYLGESQIKIMGEGTAIIDLNYMEDATGIVLGHNSNITIEGITFQKMKNGSFIKIGGSKGVIIRDNLFRYHKDSANNSKEAIDIETPDQATGSFVYTWSKSDKTVNRDITIKNNEFYQLERAIGSSKYTEGKYQTNIQLLGNTISQTDSHAVRILNWEKCVLKENKFSKITGAEGSLKAILISGGKYPVITNNIFTGIDRAIQIMPWKNTNNGSSYNITYNAISEVNKTELLANTLLDMGEYYIRYNKTFEEYTLDTEKWEIFDPNVQAFTVTSTAEPFQNNFTNYSTYNSNSKQYYMLRSYLEQMEKVGGGTLTLEAGTYEICNTLYVPSHVTLYLKDGVIIKKTEQTGSSELEGSKSIFQLAAPSKSKTVGAYGGYGGETDIKFIGEGNALIDLNYVEDGIGIVFGHNSKVSVSGITFQNMFSGHFIELDASRNITIENNTFRNHKASQSGIKEAINIDTPDINTEGFHVVWTNYDRTPNLEVVIRNNSFADLERAIGTHKYSEGKYHENIQIIDNTIENTTSDAIRIINWKTPTITGNKITRVSSASGTDRGILASGMIHPIITGNTFTDCPRAIQLMPWKNSDNGDSYAITYNEIDGADISLMLKNYLVRVGETFIRENHTYNVYETNTSKYSFSYDYTK